MRKIFLLWAWFGVWAVFAQEKEQMSLLFAGDIMGHDPQIKSAYNPQTKTYDYQQVFAQIAPIVKQNDFGIANLEVTFAGAPYKGYPNFSSPDALAEACKNSGFGYLVTANNHSCDTGKKGILRTLRVLDSVGIVHTGTFANPQEREKNNLLILRKNSLKVGLLNYTYGTNGIPVPAPTIVNQLDTLVIASDLKKAQKENLDKLIAFVHWGVEYNQTPNLKQRKMAEFLFKKGVDIIIGSHPHVVQPLAYFPESEENKERFVAYSLGNFVSNQRKPNTDGGIMVRLVLEKENGKTCIAQKGYYLTWVNKQKRPNGTSSYQILPCGEAFPMAGQGLDSLSLQKMQLFIKNTSTLFQKENKNVFEIKTFSDGKNNLLPR